MLPDRVSNPGPLTYESGALPIALRGPACYKKIGYNINDMRQTACLVVYPIKVNSFAYLLNCTTVGRTSD